MEESRVWFESIVEVNFIWETFSYGRVTSMVCMLVQYVQFSYYKERFQRATEQTDS